MRGAADGSDHRDVRVDDGIAVEFEAPTDPVANDGDHAASRVDDSPILDDLGERLSGFYALRKSDSAEADELLSALGASDVVDKEILLELAAPKPLFRPDRFLEAHTLMVRSLEVLDRNGTRKPPIPRWLGPLAPAVAYPVGLVTKFIVRSHLRSVTDSAHRLYARREANSLPDDPARALLRRGRTDLERVIPGFKRNPLGIPTFLLGGAVVSTGLGLVQRGVEKGIDSAWGAIVATVVLFVVAAGASWVILRGAAVAHRRIDLTTDLPVAALWETIGRAGRPPRDQSGAFALVSIVLTLVGVLVVPLGLFLVVFN